MTHRPRRVVRALPRVRVPMSPACRAGSFRAAVLLAGAAALVTTAVAPRLLAAEAPADSPIPRSLPELLHAESSILDALDTAVFESRRADSVMKAADAERKAAEVRMGAAMAALRQAQAREAEARARLQATLRLHRTAEPFGSAAVQVLLGDDEDLSRRTALLARLSARQAAEVAAVTESVAMAESAEFRAGIERAAAWALARTGRDARARLDEEVALHQALLGALERDRALQARRAAETTEAERQLARTIAERRNDRPGPVDFDHLKGKVKIPLAGARVAVPFGDVIHPAFKTRTPHPGLTLEFPSTQPRNIRVAAFGRVAWVGRMRGLGSTVLVDHASGWFSVYGGLSEVDTPAGTVVREGDVLGRVTPGPDEGAARLYFELRRDSEAVDPRPYLAK